MNQGQGTYYEILDVPFNASSEEVKKAWKEKSLKFHPDRDNNSAASQEYIQKINKAYETLRDPFKRTAYDFQIGVKKKPAEKEIKYVERPVYKQDNSTAWLVGIGAFLLGIFLGGGNSNGGKS